MIINEIKNFFSYPKMLLSSIIKLFETPKLLLYATIPYFILIFSFYFLFQYGYGWTDWAYNRFISPEDGWVWGAFIKIVCFLIICMTSGAISFFLMLILGGFFIDLILENILVSNDIIRKENMSFEKFVSQNFQSIKADAIVGIVVFLCVIFTFLLGIIPIVQFFTIVPIFISIISLGMSFFDRVMSVALLNIEERKDFLKTNLSKVFFVGLFASILMSIPFVNIFLSLPILIMVAKIYCDKENSEKENFMNEIEKQSSDTNSDNNNEQLN